MKYLKRFNESILDDIRNKTDKSLSDIHNKLGLGDKDHKFCGECGTKLNMSDSFCGECGQKQDDESGDKFTIEGEISWVYPGKNGVYAKTPFLKFTSPNKTLDGTKIKCKFENRLYDIGYGDLDDAPEIPTYYEDKPVKKVKVKITGTTENGKSPKFDNPLIISSGEDIEVLK